MSTSPVQATVGGLVGDNRGSCDPVLQHRCGQWLVLCRRAGGGQRWCRDQCYSTGTVRGDEYDVGGLVGINSGTVTQCYSTGCGQRRWSVGGLVG